MSLFIYYAIFCEDKNTSKIRTIFEDTSFNNCFYKGPQLGPLLFDILHHLRTYPVALTSDIEKVFLQISTEPMVQNYLFFWYDALIFDFKEIIELAETISATKINILKTLAMFFDPIGIQ